MPITPGHPFKGRHYSGEVILLAVRWYLRYLLAYERAAEMLAERASRWSLATSSLAINLHRLSTLPCVLDLNPDEFCRGVHSDRVCENECRPVRP
jgi:hypothetical protein